MAFPPLYFPVVAAAMGLVGLEEYLADTAGLGGAQEERAGGRVGRLGVGSRKLVYLHGSCAQWCRVRRGGRRAGGGRWGTWEVAEVGVGAEMEEGGVLGALLQNGNYGHIIEQVMGGLGGVRC